MKIEHRQTNSDTTSSNIDYKKKYDELLASQELIDSCLRYELRESLEIIEEQKRKIEALESSIDEIKDACCFTLPHYIDENGKVRYLKFGDEITCLNGKIVEFRCKQDNEGQCKLSILSDCGDTVSLEDTLVELKSNQDKAEYFEENLVSYVLDNKEILPKELIEFIEVTYTTGGLFDLIEKFLDHESHNN